MRASVAVACGLSSCGSWALERRLSSCGARALLLRGMWDLPRPGLKPVSPALAGGFLTTAPPGKTSKTRILSFERLGYLTTFTPCSCLAKMEWFYPIPIALAPPPNPPHHPAQSPPLRLLPITSYHHACVIVFFLCPANFSYLCCLPFGHLNSGDGLEKVAGIVRNSSQIIG